jgi:hypothetical protein
MLPIRCTTTPRAGVERTFDTTEVSIELVVRFERCGDHLLERLEINRFHQVMMKPCSPRPLAV